MSIFHIFYIQRQCLILESSFFNLDKIKNLWQQIAKVGKAMDGQIAIGGLITPIAKHFKRPILLDRPLILGET
ncbi:hypothetical protein RJT34_03837 [Clitoria ternatea]|uniref:Uncharacterized protein n=1 Tax=Clitoria ternatea TaxID=43366 RepID=A0AAN9KMY4_CLITE